MEDAPGPEVVLRLSGDHSRPRGSMRVGDGPEHQFTGWLELMRELEEAYAQRHDRAGHPRRKAARAAMTTTSRLATEASASVTARAGG
jgi:hypothetical protein